MFFCGLQKLNTLNLLLFHSPSNPRNHFSTVLIETNWHTTSCKYSGCNSLSTIYCYPVPYLNYVNNKIDFDSDAEVKLFGGPIYDIYLIEATPTTLTVQLNLHEGLPVAEGEYIGISSAQVYINDIEISSIGDNKYKATGLAIDTQHDLKITIRYTDGNKADMFKTYRTLITESIGHVEIEGTATVISGYYDLGGRLAGKQRGVNIVRYSDGTSRKIMVK